MRLLLPLLIALSAFAQKAPNLPEGVKLAKDLVYATPGEETLKLDLYLPSDAPKRRLPCILWVHGGGWKAGSKDRCPGVWLVPEGYVVASMDYRLIPAHRWPAQLDDLRAAVRWLKVNADKYGIDPKRIVAWGGSAGGHLVSVLGTADAEPEDRIRAVIDWYGPSDLLTMPPNVLSEGRTREDLAKANGALLLGGIVMDRPALAKSASALHLASAGDVPFLIMHGDKDTQVPIDQSQRLHDRLRAVGVFSVYQPVYGAGHGGKEFDSEDSRRVIRDFLKSVLR